MPEASPLILEKSVVVFVVFVVFIDVILIPSL
jgi:hypothetical protein